MIGQIKNLTRCSWCGNDPLYTKYHDEEWGKVTHDDKTLFEFLILEGAQAGLSWITILRRREDYRHAFANFEAEKIAKFADADVERLMQDAGIIRNRAKILSTITNAKLYLGIRQEFGSFGKYLYSFVPDGKPLNQIPQDGIKATSPESDALSKDMKKRGFKFFGSTICYAFMQATGMVNDHIASCDFR